jgi:RNA polymerase sigma-70 factor (ECF subfamily)
MRLPEPQSDRLKQARDGNPDAFGGIVALYEGMVYRLAYRMTFNPEDAADATQEVFLRLFQNFGKFKTPNKFGPWFLRMAVNVCINLAHKRKRTRRQEPQTPALGFLQSPLPGAEERACTGEQMDTLRRAVQELHPPYRIIVTLRYVEDLSYQDIGEILKLPVGTVKARLFRARKALRHKLKRMEIKK